MNRSSTNRLAIRKLTVTAIMSALSFGLMFIEFSIPIMPAFIKLDISDLPALITSFAYGPVYGVVVCLIKNLIHMTISKSLFIGELSNFLLGSVFVFIAGLFYRIRRDRKFAFIGAMVGDLAMAAFCLFINLYIIYPLYVRFMMPEEAILGMYRAILPSVDSLWKAILIFNVPFTFAKGLISVAITFVIYHKLSPLLKGKNSV
ncbi:MAG: ECF transporter S component [Clostridia bacterium]|nr:ECF transporter S component [Clostridia bacterium]